MGLTLVNAFGQRYNSCTDAELQFRCLRQPPVFHSGETIQAKLSLNSSGPIGVTAFPGIRRGFFREIMVWEPVKDAIDPSRQDPRIRVGEFLGSGWSEDRSQNLDINEWVQFQRPGRYDLHTVLLHLPQDRATMCELKSNAETIEILPQDTQWETAELARIQGLLQSHPQHLAAASALRYLNTPEAAVALVHWYFRRTVGSVNAEISKGIFESRYSEIVQGQLVKALRSGDPLATPSLGIIALLEAKRQFQSRPIPSEPEAARAWSRDFWALVTALESKYSKLAASPAP